MRSALQLVLFILCFFLVWTVRATVLMPIDQAIGAQGWRLAYSVLVKALFWGVPAWLVARRADPGYPCSYLRMSTPAERLPLAIGIGLLYMAGILAWEGAFSARVAAVLLHRPLSAWGLDLLGIIPSAAVEEIFFRGLLLREIERRAGFAAANVITAFLFMLIHVPNWLWMNGYQAWMPATALAIFLLALMLGLLVKISGSIWPSVGAHVFNNLIARLLQM
jgi:membrane protease YdiL (CAAX protease family)